MSNLPSVNMQAVRTRILFDDRWRFIYFEPESADGPSGEPQGLETADAEDSQWRLLDLPHDWSIESPFRLNLPGSTGKLPYAGIGWYRKHFQLQEEDRDKRIYIDFDGAMSNSQVWLNGHLVGGWPYGYTSFRLDLTPWLKYDEENVLAVRLNNLPDSSRWYPGGGLYRHVWLEKCHPVHIAHWGVKIVQGRISNVNVELQVEAELENHGNDPAELSVNFEITSCDNPDQPVAQKTIDGFQLARDEAQTAMTKLSIADPRLWDLEDPQLYLLKTSLCIDGAVVDQCETRFGVRSAIFDANQGFLLNGKRVPVNGVCQHHDLGPLGAAVNTRAMERQLELLRELGCNAIRCAHNPPAPEFLDLCDQMGFLVLDESFDTWRCSKLANDYAKLFDAWHEKDLSAMVRRDRNHPSIVMWSTGNEIAEQWEGEKGVEVSRRLREIIRQHDVSRPVTAGCNNKDSGSNGFSKTLDVMGYNYKPFKYEEFHRDNPGAPVYGSETSSCVSSRGVYFFPAQRENGKHLSGFQVTSYDLHIPDWATMPEDEFAALDRMPFVAGEFVWTGFDYLGEPTPFNDDPSVLLNMSSAAEREELLEKMKKWSNQSPSRSTYFGIYDLCGFKKDRFYLYQARWRPELPMAHILPHWNWPDRIGEITPVYVYTSGDKAELFLNGKSLGMQSKAPYQYRLIWPDVVYEPGELRVVAYKDDQPWAEAKRCTTGAAQRIVLTVDRQRIQSDGRDLAYLTVCAVDENNQCVPVADDLIRFEIAGPGKIMAVANGDAVSHQPFRSSECNLFNGLCQVIVSGLKDQAGAILLKATSDKLEPAAITVESAAGQDHLQ
ncbi:DUF4982 domain-containing protein [Candidatus Sumerlaeota bacterium]|nr:DUF4982 domain-containing protein [Candidatus Sumerlaeota bacterium]